MTPAKVPPCDPSPSFVGRVLGEWVDILVLWLVARVFGWVLAVFLSFPSRQRMSHNNGIGAMGRVRIVDDPTFPPHEFFEPGRVFPARIRHATVTFLDDAMATVRSIAIKFSHHHFKSPFDMELNSGPFSLFWSAVSFLQFAKLRKEAWGVQYQDYYRKYPDGWEGAAVSGRRDPSSFQNLRYYCKTPFLFVGKDGIRRYAKYRVLPFDDRPETGHLVDPSEWDLCNQRVYPHETRGRNYLKEEYAERVRREGAKYRMQIQTRIASDVEDPEVFNNMVLWDERIHEWKELAVIEIDRTLDWKQSTLTTFSVRNLPKSLGIIPARSIYDYNSLNYMRYHSVVARKARLLSYRVFGMVPPIPDNDNRNVSGWGE